MKDGDKDAQNPHRERGSTLDRERQPRGHFNRLLMIVKCERLLVLRAGTCCTPSYL